jgi:hypothetical protein
MLEHSPQSNSNHNQEAQNTSLESREKLSPEQEIISSLEREISAIDIEILVKEHEITAYEKSLDEIKTKTLKELKIVDSEEERVSHIKLHKSIISRVTKVLEELLLRKESIAGNIKLVHDKLFHEKKIQPMFSGYAEVISNPEKAKALMAEINYEQDAITVLNKKINTIIVDQKIREFDGKIAGDIAEIKKLCEEAIADHINSWKSSSKSDDIVLVEFENMRNDPVLDQKIFIIENKIMHHQIQLEEMKELTKLESDASLVDDETIAGLSDLRKMIKVKKNAANGMTSTPSSSSVTVQFANTVLTSGDSTQQFFRSSESNRYPDPRPYSTLSLQQQEIGRLLDQSLIRDQGFIEAKEAFLNDLLETNTKESILEATTVKQEIEILKKKLALDLSEQSILARQDVVAKIGMIEREEMKGGYKVDLAQERRDLAHGANTEIIETERKLVEIPEMIKAYINEIVRLEQEIQANPSQEALIATQIRSFKEDIEDLKFKSYLLKKIQNPPSLDDFKAGIETDTTTIADRNRHLESI